MKTSAKKTLSTPLIQLLVNLWYIHISCLGKTLWCTQVMIQCCFGVKKPQLEERLCTPVWQTTPWQQQMPQQQMPQKLSLLMVQYLTTTELLLIFSLTLHHVLIKVPSCIPFIPQMTKIKFLPTILKRNHWDRISRICYFFGNSL